MESVVRLRTKGKSSPDEDRMQQASHVEAPLSLMFLFIRLGAMEVNHRAGLV